MSVAGYSPAAAGEKDDRGDDQEEVEGDDVGG